MDPRVKAPDRRPILGAAAIVVAAFLGGGWAGWSQEPSAPPAPSPAPADSVAILVRRLPTAVYTHCHRLPEREGGGRTVAVKCDSAAPGADELLVSQWTSPTSMVTNFATTYARRYDKGPCRDFNPRTTKGRHSTWAGGGLACYVNSNNAAILLWQYDDKALEVAAVRRDRDAGALFAWWLAAVTHPVT